MSAEAAGEPVKFISTEKAGDLVVSFAIADAGIWGVVSLTLIRTPEFEFALGEEERGVKVSHESYPESEIAEMLQRVRIAPPVVTIETTARRYELDVSRVERKEIQSAVGVLKRMNFDARFTLEKNGAE